jgi:integrase
VSRKHEKRVKGVYEKEPGSDVWYARYADANGEIKREKAGTKSAAIKLYQKRKTEVLQGKKLPENLRSIVRVNDLADAIERDYRINGKKSLESLQRRLKKHILPFFGTYSANDVTTADIDKYVDLRRREGAQNATINRELAALKRMYHLGLHSTPPKVHHVPAMTRLQEASPRIGFVEEAQYNLLAAHAPENWLQAMVLNGYTYGFSKSELLSLRVRQIDLLNKKIRLEVGSTKNNEGRTVSMTPDVLAALTICVHGKGPEDLVFTRKGNQPILDFRGSWYGLCKRAGLGTFVEVDDKRMWKGLLFHDLRRSAVRNMIRRGVPERVAMMISGHKTRSVFDRYNVVSESDLDRAAVQIAAGRRRELEIPTDTKTGTTHQADVSERASDYQKAQLLQ